MAKYPTRNQGGQNRGGMDPDRFQMKDIKRRLSLLEKAHSRLLARHDRLVVRLQRDQKSHDDIMMEVQALLNRQ